MEALLEITGSDSMAVIEPTPIARPIVPRTLDKRLVHKAFEENVLLSHIDEVARGQMVVDNEGRPIRKDHFRGTLYIQRNHTFFFEHHRDHVPGLYLIEAGRQMSVAVAHRFYDVPSGVEFVMTDLHVWFRNMANIHDPLIIENAMSQHIYRKGQLAGMHSSATVRQGGTEVAFMSGSMILMDKNLLKRLERRGGKA
jgi:hypothetical protein